MRPSRAPGRAFCRAPLLLRSGTFTMISAEVHEKGNGASSGATIACFDPATRAPLGSVPVASKEAVRAAVARAREAQRRFRVTSFAERRRVLQRLLDRVLDDAERLVELVCRDCGKTRENALMGEIWPVCEKLRYTIANGERHLSPERVSSGML